MKKLTLYTIIIFLTISCGSNRKIDTTGVAEAVDKQLEYYPELELMDLYKSFFQDNFGPGHIAPDSVIAYTRIISELHSAEDYGSPYYEAAGRGNNFYRVSLQVVSDSLVPVDLYFRAFYSSIKDVRPVDIKEWREEWNVIKTVIDSMNLSLPGYEEQTMAIDSLLKAGEYAYHHSRAYNANYHPHYRLIRKDIFLNEIKPLIDQNSSK